MKTLRAADPAGEDKWRTPLSDAAVASLLQKHPLLRPLLVTMCGFWAPGSLPAPLLPRIGRAASFLYCTKGEGWCRVNSRLAPLRAGDFLVLPPRLEAACDLTPGHPWTVYWAHAVGDHLPEYLEHLQAQPGRVLRTNGDPQIARLFTEILRTRAAGSTFPYLLHASLAMGYLLAHLISQPYHAALPPSAAPQKVAQAIVYMSEHLGEPLRITALARLAGLSTAHFSVLFKEETGCSPRDYLHLLRMHQACELLRGSDLPIKEIASRLGYQDQFHFSRQFKAFQGVSPSDYRGQGTTSGV